MKLEKINEEVVYKKLTKQHTIKVGDKEVIVYEYSNCDYDGDYDYDYDINDKDKKNLTDEELETLEDYLSELLSNDVGHLIDVK